MKTMNGRSIALCVALVTTTMCAQAGDAKRGQQAFSACQVCHTFTKGAPNGLGPNLFGVVGRKAASVSGFYYSVSLRNSKIVWTNERLKAWVMGPYKLIPGNRMAFAGISDPKIADDIVAYLDTLK